MQLERRKVTKGMITTGKESLSSKIRNFIYSDPMYEQWFVLIIATFIGIIAGFSSLLIRIMINGVSHFVFPGAGSLLENISQSPWYLTLLIPAAGGLIAGPIIYFFAREAKGHGVPEVMQAIILKGGRIKPRVAIVKAVTAALSIGTGGSVGREGPVIQIGASIGSGFGQIFNVSNIRMRTFVGSGAAAGIAAAFNAPIAGALFAVEIILQDFTFVQFAPIVISSVMATVVSHHFEGDLAAFQVPEYSMQSLQELIFYLFLAVLTALVGVLFTKVLYFFEDLFDEKLSFPPYLKPVIGGLLVGAIGIYFPHVMGVGYDSITAALNSTTVWYMALSLIFLKILATSLTLGSGGSGGIFAPSLFLGAMLGVAYGGVIHSLFPGITGSPGAYALVAMGGLVASTTRAPITAIIMVFELTSDYRIILPLMITCIVSTMISSLFMKESIYTLKLLQRGIFLKDGAETNIMKSIFVRELFSQTTDILNESDSFEEVVNKTIKGVHPYLPVMGKNNKLTGIISLHDIKEYLNQGNHLKALLIADDMSNKDLITVTPEENCQDVLDKMSRQNLTGLPVVSSHDKEKLLGMIWRKDITDAYNMEVESRDIASSYASRITMKNVDSTVHFLEGHVATEIPVPSSFVGRTIAEINVRANYGVEILLIRRNDEKGPKIKAIPSADYSFSFNDSIVIAGEDKKIEKMKLL